MKAQVLTGSKREITETFIRIAGEIHEVIVFVQEPTDSTLAIPESNVFAEMEPFMVEVGGADYSRQSLYTRMEGE
jgi:hypothetical protein